MTVHVDIVSAEESIFSGLAEFVVAHGVIDSVAFVGYALLAGHLTWLR